MHCLGYYQNFKRVGTLDRDQTVAFRELRDESVFVKEGCGQINDVLYKFQCFDDKIIVTA